MAQNNGFPMSWRFEKNFRVSHGGVSRMAVGEIWALKKFKDLSEGFRWWGRCEAWKKFGVSLMGHPSYGEEVWDFEKFLLWKGISKRSVTFSKGKNREKYSFDKRMQHRQLIYSSARVFREFNGQWKRLNNFSTFSFSEYDKTDRNIPLWLTDPRCDATLFITLRRREGWGVLRFFQCCITHTYLPSTVYPAKG
jgi:hypothetical protein